MASVSDTLTKSHGVTGRHGIGPIITKSHARNYYACVLRHEYRAFNKVLTLTHTLKLPLGQWCHSKCVSRGTTTSNSLYFHNTLTASMHMSVASRVPCSHSLTNYRSCGPHVLAMSSILVTLTQYAFHHVDS
jgi:hypothetical protein